MSVLTHKKKKNPKLSRVYTWFLYLYLPNLQIVSFIQTHNILTPNGSKSITEIELGDIVVLGKQLCLVTKISGPYSTTLPMDSDKSANPKKAIALTGRSILWPKIEYDHSFLHHDDNKIGTLSGKPDMYAGDLVLKRCSNISSRVYLTCALSDRH